MKSFLIEAEELNALSGQTHVKVFDVRGTWQSPARGLPEDYQAEHIAGAHFLDWTQEFIEQGPTPGLAAVASREEAEVSFRKLGINDGDLVVLYDDYSHMMAGRIWWAMRYWGFDNVRVLNGGFSYWKSQSFPTSTDVPTVDEGIFQPVETPELRVELDQILSLTDETYLIDARGSAGYIGNPDDPRTGHIPAAISLPFKEFLNPDIGQFLPPDEIEKVLDQFIPDWRSKPVISSCGSGYSATVAQIAMAEVGKFSPLYDGSFGEWKQNPERPVAQGE